MSLLNALILGLIQGLTEFLPISSSAHLVLGKYLLGANMPNTGILFEVALHLGTLGAVFVYFRKRMAGMIRALVHREDRENRNMIGYIILGTLPAAVVGLLFKDKIDEAFSSPRLAAGMLLVTATLLIITHFVSEGKKALGWKSAWWVGVSQAVAITPGISRSGSTIAAGIFQGIPRVAAAEYSFLLSIPAVLGAAILEIPNAEAVSAGFLLNCAAGAVVSFVAAWLTMGWLMRLIQRGKLFYFGLYCLLVGATFLIFL